MRAYVIRRLGQFIPVLLLATIIVWAMLFALPGSPAQVLAGEDATPEQIAAIEARYGLDQPVWLQYLTWLGHLFQGDWGTSLVNGHAVAQLIGDRLPATAQLAVLAMALTLVIAVPLGIAVGLHPRSWYGRLTNGFLATGLAAPTFWIGLLLILLLSVKLNWLPAASRFVPFWESPVGALRHTILPALAIALHASTVTARFVASSLSEVMHRDFIRTARAKGASEGTVLRRHALRNALVPTITVVGLQLGSLLGGAVVTEVVFAYPGLGRLLFTAIDGRDFSLIQGSVLVVIAIFIVLNLLVDVLYAFLDPRIRFD